MPRLITRIQSSLKAESPLMILASSGALKKEGTALPIVSQVLKQPITIVGKKAGGKLPQFRLRMRPG
jgi:hypothetical protein